MSKDKMELEEAIEYLEQFIGIKKEYKYKPIKVKTMINTSQAIETVLQALEKLQKHCKEMIKEKQELSSALLDSIPKKKIEDKILQKWQKCPKNSINDFAIVERNNKIQNLQELLEDK